MTSPLNLLSLSIAALLTTVLIGCGGGDGATPAPLPAANEPPTNVRLVEVSSMAVGQISASWLPAADDSTPAANLKYQLHVSTESSFVPSSQTLRAETTGQVSATITSDLTPGSRYFVRLVAIDQQGALTAADTMAVTVADTSATLDPSATLRTLGIPEYTRVTVDSVTLSSSASEPAIGTFVASADGTGFLRQVTAVSSAGGSTVLITRQAALNEVISEVQVSSSLRMTPVPGAAVSAARAHALSVRAAPNQLLSSLAWTSTGLTYSAGSASPAVSVKQSSGARSTPSALTPRFDVGPTTTINGKWAKALGVSRIGMEEGASGKLDLYVATTTVRLKVEQNQLLSVVWLFCCVLIASEGA